MEIIMDPTLRFACSTIISALVIARNLLVAFILATILFTAYSSPAEATVRFDSPHQEWTLQTGNVEYRLGQKDGAVYLKYFGPLGQPTWDLPTLKSGRPVVPPAKYEMAGQAEGEGLTPPNLELVSQEILHPATGVDELQLIYKHRRLPLQIAVQYFTWGDTGVLTRQLTMVNKGEKSIRVESLPSLALDLPGGNYELSYLWGGWGRERELATEQLGAGRRSFVSTYGRSTRSYAPWFCLHSKELGIRFLAELAYSGNWEMSFEKMADARRIEEVNLDLSLGMRPDFGGPLALSPGESFTLPAVAFTATAGDIDDGANQLHRYQRQFVVPQHPTNDPLLVQFNSWYPFPGKDDGRRHETVRGCRRGPWRGGFRARCRLVQQTELVPRSR